MPTEYPVPDAANPPALPAAWSPKGIAGMAVLLSFLPAGILWSLNWGRLGQPEKIRSRLFWVVILFVPYLEIVYRRMGRNEDALHEIDTLVDLAPDFHDDAGLTLAEERQSLMFDLEFERARAAIDAGDAAKAVAAFTRLAQARPDDVAAHWNLALAHGLADNHDEARRQIDDVRRLDPEGHVIAPDRVQELLDTVSRPAR